MMDFRVELYDCYLVYRSHLFIEVVTKVTGCSNC